MRVPNTTQDLFRTNKEQWIQEARQIAQKLLLNRGQITIEDLLEVHPLPKYIKKNLLGRVFQDDIFQAVGYTKARRTMAKGHIIRIWELNADYYPTNMLMHTRRHMEEYGYDS